MNYEELNIAVAAKTGQTVADTKRVTRAIIEVIQETLPYGENIRIANLGTLGVRTREAHQHRDVGTGELISVPAKKRIYFHAAKKLKELCEERADD